MADDKFFDDLEEEINSNSDSNPDRPESIAFKKFEERGLGGFHSKVRSYSDCQHIHKTLNDEARMIQCDDCQAYLDPFDSLKRLILNTENSQRTGKQLKNDLNDFVNKVIAAKKELKSLDQKIKRRSENLKKDI